MHQFAASICRSGILGRRCGPKKLLHHVVVGIIRAIKDSEWYWLHGKRPRAWITGYIIAGIEIFIAEAIYSILSELLCIHRFWNAVNRLPSIRRFYIDY